MAAIITTANALKSATTIVNVSAATAPSANQVLTATSSTAATWQASAGGLTSKVITFTRDIAGTAGDVAYTGVGFIPTCILFNYSTTDAKCMGAGSVDSGKGMAAYFSAQQAGYLAAVHTTSKCIYFSNASGTDQTALLKTFDSDGFTLTWAKTSTPTGTGNVIATCFK